MCGRFALTAPASTIAEIFQVDVLPDVLPRYNVAPTQEVLAVVEDEHGERKVESFRWGLIPFWAKDKKIAYRTINARSESASTKPAFRGALQRRRLLILADGFYEWKRSGKAKQPHLIQLADGKPFAIAGLWERWIDPETQEEVRTCTILTTGPNALMEPIHDRMPVILPADRWDTWLDRQLTDAAALQELMVPYPAEGMKERPVSDHVNNARHQGEACQAPPDEEP